MDGTFRVSRADRVQKRHRRRCARECMALYRIRSGHGHWLDYRIQDEVGKFIASALLGWSFAIGVQLLDHAEVSWLT